MILEVQLGLGDMAKNVNLLKNIYIFFMIFKSTWKFNYNMIQVTCSLLTL